ncbi:MAG: hypothetical protein BGN82_10495 [Alphaproteobacteria bacterium 65-7]|nr:MAG: hypothetical protein BGN82_10495 [Alphaproteobacteria bacterium 65-7]
MTPRAGVWPFVTDGKDVLRFAFAPLATLLLAASAAAHANPPSWSQTVVRDEHYPARFIQMAPGAVSPLRKA